MNPEMLPPAPRTLQAANLPQALCSELLPALELLAQLSTTPRASGC